MMSLLNDVGGDLDRRSRLPLTLAKALSKLLGQLTIRQVRDTIHKLPDPASDDEVLLAKAGDGESQCARFGTNCCGIWYLRFAVRPPNTGGCGIVLYGMENIMLAESCCRSVA